jgi:uncharacterized protein (DUF2141 family)
MIKPGERINPVVNKNSSKCGPIRVICTATLASVLVCGAPNISAAADAPNIGTLTLDVTGFVHTRGHAVAKLYAPGDNVLGPGHWQVHAPIDGNTAVLRFEGLPPGHYAAVVFHDENDNGVIDHGLLGPTEPIGFSGGFVLNLLSGRPDFERLKFDFKPPAQTLELQLR